MKKVNFIMPLSPQKQYAIRRWFWVTFFLCLCAVVMSGYFVVPQLLTYRALKKEVDLLREKTSVYATSIKNKETFTTEHDMVRKRTKKIDSYNESPKNPHQYVAAIMQACGDGATLEAINFNKKECEITLLCPSPEHATVFMQRLSLSDLFKNVKLVSLQHEAQTKKFKCIIKSIINRGSV